MNTSQRSIDYPASDWGLLREMTSFIIAMTSSGDGSQQEGPQGPNNQKTRPFACTRPWSRSESRVRVQLALVVPPLHRIMTMGTTCASSLRVKLQGNLADREVQHPSVANATIKNFCNRARASHRDFNLRRQARPKYLPQRRGRDTRNQPARLRKRPRRHFPACCMILT